MLRKEAKNKLKLGWSYLHDGKAYVNEERIYSAIDIIYDGFEEQLKIKDKEIERLKERALYYAAKLSFVTMDDKYKNSELSEQGMLKDTQ